MKPLLLPLVLCATALLTRCQSADELFERAEDEDVELLISPERQEEVAERVSAAIDAGGRVLVLNADEIATWADQLTEVQFASDGVDDEILPYIPVGATNAELKEAPMAKGMAVAETTHMAQETAMVKAKAKPNMSRTLLGPWAPVPGQYPSWLNK